MRTIAVKTASAAYPVFVGSGLLKTVPDKIRRQFGKGRRRVFVLTSPEIWALWGETLAAGFDEAPSVLFLPPGETYKRMAQIERLATEMADAGGDRASLLIAFGGGIIGDMGGFLAAIYMRGIPYIQIPTTLLAQVDSSVGGKTGANLATGKNLIGSFHHPQAVFADVSTLKTLPARELRAGLFESVKAGIIRDASLFRFLEKQSDLVLSGDEAALQKVIAASVAMKAEVVGIDERENGLRMILNFGHTVGHAIEAATGYKKLLHGEAVGWGMLAALELSRRRGVISEKEAARIETVIRAYGPLPAFRAKTSALLDAAGRDKKNKAGVRRFILTEGVGKSIVVEDVTDVELESIIDWTLAEAAR
ncbi:3-dehydroquinate synthase [Silvibacterium sp.]|uniref:3-dehydroquinate synthase n=1 Tax=Silvibacterium sp. TaxID=1964179 RepID=UPI0039E644B3